MLTEEPEGQGRPMSRSKRNGHCMTAPAKYKRSRRASKRMADKQAMAHGREPEADPKSDRYHYW